MPYSHRAEPARSLFFPLQSSSFECAPSFRNFLNKKNQPSPGPGPAPTFLQRSGVFPRLSLLPLMFFPQNFNECSPFCTTVRNPPSIVGSWFLQLSLLLYVSVPPPSMMIFFNLPLPPTPPSRRNCRFSPDWGFFPPSSAPNLPNLPSYAFRFLFLFHHLISQST